MALDNDRKEKAVPIVTIHELWIKGFGWGLSIGCLSSLIVFLIGYFLIGGC